MIITNLGQEYAVRRVQSGQVLPVPAVQRDNAAASDVTRVSISEQSASREHTAIKANEKYTALVEDLNASSSAQEAQKGEAATGLDSLPPLKFFNKEDVEAYEKTLMAELAARGVDTSVPIKLTTDFEGKVVVVGEHPDKAAIEQTFEDDMDLRNGFVQTSNYFLFKEIGSLHEQWAEKIEQGMTEETANLWLINAVKNAVTKNSGGLSLENGGFNDPFGNKGTSTSSVAMKAYQT